MPIQATIKFDEAAYDVTVTDEKNGKAFVKFDDKKDLNKVYDLNNVNFNKNTEISIYPEDWNGKGVINIVGKTAVGGAKDVNKPQIEVVEGATLHWPTFDKSAVLEAKIQDMIVEEIKKQLPAGK